MAMHSLTRYVQSLSPIWIIPLVALVVGVWLGVITWREKGQEIEIIFDSASGIEVNKTHVRLKDVAVGKVTRIRLTDDLSKVRVVVTLDRQVAEHVGKNTRFWLVTPRISASGVSNLGTLVSGVYIVMDPGKPGPPMTQFEGLNEPPAVKSDEQGAQYILQAETLGSLDIGSPVYFRQLKVGEVTGYKLGDGGDHVEIRIFIQAPHNRLVLTRSRFWNVSGFGVSLGADGFKAQMASLVSLLSGGIAFDNSGAFESSTPAESERRFYLYADKESVLEGRYNLKYFYLLKFSETVRGLSVGAPVEFRGIKVGEVIDVVLSGVDKGEKNLQVFITLEPQRLNTHQPLTRDEVDAQIAGMVRQGLHAQLKTASMVTGSRYVDLFFPDRKDPGELVRYDNYAEIPTVDDKLAQLDRQLADVAEKINRFPMDKIGEDLSAALGSLRQMVALWEQKQTATTVHNAAANVEKLTEELDDTVAEANKALRQLSETLKTVDDTVAPDSRVHYELTEMLNAVSKAASSFERLTEKLNRKPDALIFGAGKDE